LILYNRQTLLYSRCRHFIQPSRAGTC